MVILDKYYTKTNLSFLLIDITFKKIDDIKFDCIIEPSAGNGSFSDELTKHNNSKFSTLLFFDIEPEKNGIMREDFLSLKNNTFDKYNNILCIGNPPFGKQNNLAIKFFNKCASFNNVSYIAMIFPKSFRKNSIQNKLNLYFHLFWEEDIPDNSFISSDGNITYNIPCIFQIWKKEKNVRIIHKPETLKNTNNIEFIKN